MNLRGAKVLALFIGIDSKSLVFKLNASGRVTETRVVTD